MDALGIVLAVTFLTRLLLWAVAVLAVLGIAYGALWLAGSVVYFMAGRVAARDARAARRVGWTSGSGSATDAPDAAREHRP